ncbi:MAG: diguanylate cyclase [Magnetococcales bacterium]|nr:diguanylate cyclase [Magnetococcales bacterium]
MQDKKSHNNEPMFRWTIARKIGGLSAIMILFILILLGYSIYTLRGLQKELVEIAHLDVPLTELINKVEIEQLEQQITIDKILRLGKKDVSTKTANSILESKNRLENHAIGLKSNIQSGIKISIKGLQTKHKHSFNQIHNSLQAIKLESENIYPRLLSILDIIEKGSYPDKKILDEMVEMGENFDIAILGLVKKIELFTQRNLAMMERHEKVFMIVNTSLGVAGVLLGIILSILVIIGIRKNLFRLSRHITEVTKAVAENRDIPVAETVDDMQVSSSDEISHLASELNSMVKSVSKNFQQREEISNQLKQLATTDQLTGAFNRVKWEEDQALEVERVKRGSDNLSLIMFDIDHFKRVNDTYGHDVGDEILVGVVKLAKGAIRKSDILYRTGGEEFIILAPITNIQQVLILAEKVREEIAGYTFNKVGKITISLGCTQFDKETIDDTTTKMLKRADEALYRAKEGGRNQVCY